MVRIQGKPFLEYQIELLCRNDVRDIVLCVGHFAEQIEAHFGDGQQYRVHISYSYEGERQLGTAGALKFAENILADVFFVMFGDSYLILDYQEIMNYFLARDNLGLMVVYRNDNRYDTSDILVQDGLITAYDKEYPLPQMVYINHGLSVLNKKALALIPSGKPTSLQEFFKNLIAQRQLLAFKTKHRFYEIGSFAGLRMFEILISKGDLLK
jgi:NDP-sugar pyrophosphorylase family protein